MEDAEMAAYACWWHYDHEQLSRSRHGFPQRLGGGRFTEAV